MLKHKLSYSIQFIFCHKTNVNLYRARIKRKGEKKKKKIFKEVKINVFISL